MAIAPWPDHLLSLAEWEALEYDPLRRLELVRGAVVVVPRPTVFHQHAITTLCGWLRGGLPATLVALPEVEVLVDAGPPATARTPDVVVVPRSAIAADRARVAASDVRLAVEVLSPGSVRTDTVIKPAEYADAGIGAYWIVDLQPPVSLTAHLLVDGGYEITAKGTGEITLASPWPLSLDLTRLLP